jgi:uncharacterized membrane protein YeaQ/YmgE (transglycosylase-associated protein family)
MWILWTIVIGFIAGVLAKFVTPGDEHEPQGFILTTLLGIGGAFVATFLGKTLGWYQEGRACAAWHRTVNPDTSDPTMGRSSSPKAVQDRIAAVGASTAYITPGSPSPISA